MKSINTRQNIDIFLNSVMSYAFYTESVTFVPPLCDHETGEVVVGGTEEAKWLHWSFKGGSRDTQTSPRTPWSPRSFKRVQDSRKKAAEEVGCSKIAQTRQNEGVGKRIAVDAE